MHFIFSLFSWFFPEQCVGCNRSGSWLCYDCKKIIQPNLQQVCPISLQPSNQGKVLVDHEGIDSLMVFASYKDNPVLQKLLYRLKYHFAFDVAKYLGAQLDQLLQSENFTEDVIITAVPLHWKRQWQRGFNQSALLAKEIGQTQELLKRVKNTSKQAKLSKIERRNNLKNAFVFCEKEVPEKVLLVDDVASTCSTLNECAKTLKKAGVKQVYAVVLARNI